jgi:hypothetical protein
MEEQEQRRQGQRQGHDPRQGMRVVAADGAALGRLERYDGDDLHVAGLHVPPESVARVDGDTVHLLHERSHYTP